MTNEIKKQKYLYEGKSCEIVSEFIFNNQNYVVLYLLNNDWFKVDRKDNLMKEEDSYEYQRMKALKEEIEKLQKNKKVEVEKIADEAIKTLEMRLRINSAFSEDGKMSTVGIAVANELKKLVKKERTDDRQI